jgi:hypothetical protein
MISSFIKSILFLFLSSSLPAIQTALHQASTVAAFYHRLVGSYSFVMAFGK